MNDLFEGFEGVKPVEAASDPFADFEGVTPVGHALPAAGDPLSAFRAKLADPKEYERIKKWAGYLGTTPEDPIVAQRLTNPLNFSSYSTLNQLMTTGNVDEVNDLTPEGNVAGLGLKAALTQFGHAGGIFRRRNDALVSRIAAGQEMEVGDTRDIGAQIATGMAGVPRPNLRTFKKIEDMTRAEQDATVPKEIVDLVNQYDTPEAPLDARTRAKAIYEAAKSSATAREQTMEMAAEELALREELTGKSDGFMNSLGVLAAKGMPTVGYGQTFLVGAAIGGPAGAFAAATAVSGADKTSELLTADINPDTGEVEKQGTDYDDARTRGYAYGARESASEIAMGKVLGAALKGLDKVTGGYVGKTLSKGLDAGARQMAKTPIGRGIAEFAKGVQRIASLSAVDNPFMEILGEEAYQQWDAKVFAQRPSDTEVPVYVKNVFNEATGEMEQMRVEPGSDEERTAKRMLARYGEKSGYAEAGTRQMTVGEKTKEFGEEFFTWENLTALAEGFALQYVLTLGGGALHAVQTKEGRRVIDNALLAAGGTNADLILMSDERKAKAFAAFYGAEANRDKFPELFKDAGETLSLFAQRVVDSDRWMRTGEGVKPNFSVDVAKETENGAATVDDEQSGLSVDYTSTLEGTAFTVRDRDGVLSPMTFNTAEEAQKGAEKMSQMKQGRQMDMEKRAEVATRVAQVFAPGRNVVLVQSDKDMKAAAVAEGADAAQYKSGAPGLTTPNGTIVVNVAATTSFDELVKTVKHETGHSVADEAGLTKLMAGKTVDGIAAEFQKAGIIAPGAVELAGFLKAVESVRAQYAARGVKLSDADAVAEVLSMQQEGMTPLFRKKFGDGLVTLLRGKDKSAENMGDVRRAVALIMYGGREAKVDPFGGIDAWKAPAPAFTGDPIAAAGTETGEKEAVEPAEEAAPEAMPAQGEEAPGAEAVPPVAAPEAKPPTAPSPEAEAAAKDIKAAFEAKQKAKAPVEEAAPVETPTEAPKSEPPAPATPVAKMTFPTEEAMLEYVRTHPEETENWTEESFEIVPAPAPAKSDGAPIVPTSEAGQGEAVPPKAEEKRPDAAPFEVEGLKFNGVQRIEGMEDQQVWTDTATGGTFFMPGDADKAAVEAYRDGSRKKFEDAKKPAPAKPEAPRNDGSLFPEVEIPFNLASEEQPDVQREAAEKKAEEERLAEAKRKKDAEPILPGIDNEKKEAQNADQERGAEEVAGGEQAGGAEKDGGGDVQGSEAAGTAGKPEGEGLQKRAVEVEPQVAKMSAEVEFESVPKKGQYAEIPGVSTAQGKRMYLIPGKWGDGSTFHVSPTHHGIVLTGMGVLLRTKGQPSAHSGVRIVGGGKAPEGSEKWGVAEWATHNQKLSNRHKGGAKPVKPAGIKWTPENQIKTVADYIEGLRAPDVFRLLSETPIEHRSAMGAFIREHHRMNRPVIDAMRKAWETLETESPDAPTQPSPAPQVEPPKVEAPPAPKMKFASEEEMMRYVSAHPELNWTGDEFEIVPDEKGEAAPAAPQTEQEAAPAVAQFEPPKIKYGENTAAHRRRVAAAKAEWDKEQAAKADADKVSPEPRQSIDKVSPEQAKIEQPSVPAQGDKTPAVGHGGGEKAKPFEKHLGYAMVATGVTPEDFDATLRAFVDRRAKAVGGGEGTTIRRIKVVKGDDAWVKYTNPVVNVLYDNLNLYVPVEQVETWNDVALAQDRRDLVFKPVERPAPADAKDAKDTEEIAELQANAETQARVRAIPDAEYAAAPARAAFDAALPIYEKQTAPDRTALKRELQQFSTPVTLAVLAAHGAYGARTFVEPTIGNAALTAGLRPDADGNMPRILGNELDAGRAARANDFIETSFGQKDAVTVGDWAAEAFQNAVKEAAKSGKVAYAMNPPFGPVNPVTGMKLEHDIVIKTIESAVPGDTLFAILQAPGRDAMKMTTGALAGVYTAGAFAKFHAELNRRGWKATLHFIADGALYRKMGASFPVEVLLMEKTDGSEMNPHMPMRDLPARYSTWEQIRAAVAEMYDPGAETLGERVANDLDLSGKAEQARAEAQGNAEASSAEVNAARVKEGAAGTLRYRLSQDIELGLVTPETGLTLNPFMMKINGKVWDKEFAGKVRNPDQLARHIVSLPEEIAEARIKVADAIVKHLAANPANGFVTGTDFHSMGPALREAFEARWNAARTTDMDAEEDKAQLEYAPLSAVKVASPMKMPRELAGGMAVALSSFDERHPEGIDTFVAEKMGWPLAQAIDGRLDGSQMDTLGLALEKIDEGTGFIVGSQCVAGETRIYDPRTGTHCAIRDLCEKGEPITVLSLTPNGLVPAPAGIPFLKGVEDLYRVTMDDGRSITVTREHRFLTPVGWQALGDGLRAGHFLASAEGHPACSLGYARSTQPEGDRRSPDTTQDCPESCRHGHCSCDEQPRLEADSAQASAPLPACAPEHILGGCGEDDSELSQECTRVGRSHAPRARSSSSPSENRAPSPTCSPTSEHAPQALIPTHESERPSHHSSVSPHPESGEIQAGQSAGGASRSTLPVSDVSHPMPEEPVVQNTDSFPSPAPHREDACPRDTAQQHAASVQVKASLFGFPLEYHTGWRRIVAIEFVRTDEFFDMVVPGAANYTAEGFINHNTGAGKGRVMASVMDYHRKQGRVPIFLTAQAKLFTDIWRDLTATGGADALKPLVMNDYKAPKNEDPDSEDVDAFSMPVFFTPVQRNSALSEGNLPQGANAIFLTYSQVQNPTANTRRKIDLIKTLLASGKGALVMDEAHLAAGADSNRGAVLREFADLAKPGVVFSSATFAKRGENMTLYKRAGYSQFFKNDEDMEKALMVGGVPFQQYLAARLTERGFYVRHELDYEGVVFSKLTTIDTLGTLEEGADMFSPESLALKAAQTALSDREEQIADVFNQVVRTVMRFGGLVRSVNSRLQKGAPGANMDGAAFMSSLHNTASFIYTALKAETVANAAVAELRAGLAPVVTLYNTNQALLTEIGLNQSANVGRYLTRISERAVSIQMPDGSSASILTPAGFGELVRLVKAQEATMLRDAADALVRQARSAADYLQEQNLPASPIDRVREIVQNAGYQFGEVTGRTIMVQNGVVVRRIKPNPDTVIRQFNQGAPDGSPNMVLLLNSSGSTGLSAHASSDFRNQARRVMFVLQPSWDINEMMQMFGRVNRKNQLSKPIYHLVFTSAAGEQRNAAILMSKLRSLAANTSGVSKAGYGEAVEDALDFMNAFGDKALAELAAERNPVVASINTLRASTAIRTATSVSQFLPVREQEQFIGQIQAKVAALQDNAREAGLHDLEAGDIGRVPLSVEQLLSNTAMRAYEVPVLGRGKILTASEAVEAAQAWQAKHPTMLDDAKAKIDKAIADTSNPWLKRIYGDTAQVLEHALDSIGRVYYVRDDVGGGRRWFVPIEAHLPPSGTAQTASDWRVKVSFNTIRGVTTIPLSIFADKILSNAAKSSERNYNETLTRKEDRTIIAGDVAQALIGNIVATGASGTSQIVRALPVDGNFSSFVLMMPRGVTVANAKKIVSSRLEKVTDVMDIRVGQNGYLEIDAARVKVTPTYSSTTGDQIGAVFAFRIATPIKSKSKEITVAQIMRAAGSESRLRDTPNSQGYVTGPYLGVDESNTALKNLAALHPALQATQIVSDEAKVGGQDAVARNAPRSRLAGVTLDAEYADAVAKGDMETAQRMVDARLAEIGSYWHGTPSGDLRGGVSGLHIGTKQAAMDALEARIGIPADGNGWDGTREYGKTLLAGKNRIRTGQFGKYRETGYNAGEKGKPLPDEDFYPADYAIPTVGNGTKVDLTWKPWVRPVLIVGPMAIRKKTDSAANSSMRRLLRQGRAVEGFYYKNEAEDYGSTSAVLPNGEYVRVKLADPVTYDDAGRVIPLSERFNSETADIRFKLPGVTLDGGISAPVRVGELRTQTQLENDDPVGFPILDHIRGGSRIIIPRGAIGRKGEYNWFTSIGGLKAFYLAEQRAFFRHPKAALGEKKSHGNIDRLAKELKIDDVETFANAFMAEVDRSRALYREQKERQARRRAALEAVSESDLFKGKTNIGEIMGQALGSVYAELTGDAKTTMDMILTHEGDEAGRDYMLMQHLERIVIDMDERYAFLEGRYEPPPEVEDRALSVNVPINQDGDTRSVYAQTKQTLRLLAARFYAPNPAGVATITDEDAAVFMRESLDVGGPEFLRELAEKMIAERLTGQRDTALNKYQTALLLWYQTDLDAQTMETDRLAQEAADMNDLSTLKGVDMMRDRIHGKTLDYLNAARQYGSLAGQSLQALKLRVDHAFNIVKIYRQAYQDNGDIALTPQQYAALKARVAALEKKWNDYMEAASLPDGEAELDARVVELEKKLADATTNRDSLKATVAQLEAKKAALEAEYAKQSGEATAFSEKKAQLEAQIAGLENEIALREALNQQVEELQGKVDALQAKLDALDAEYAGASPELLASLEKQLADLTALYGRKLADYTRAEEDLKAAVERVKRVQKLIEKLGKGEKAKIVRRRAMLEHASNLYGVFKQEMEAAQVERLKNRWRGSVMPDDLTFWKQVGFKGKKFGNRASLSVAVTRDLIRALQSMGDESVAGRQLAKLGLAHPFLWARAWAQSQPLVFSRAGAVGEDGHLLTWAERSDRRLFELDQMMREHPMFDVLVRKGGMSWMDLTADPQSFDEQQTPVGPLLRAMLPSKFTRGYTSLLEVSNNHYAGMSNMLRFAAACQLYEKFNVAKGETPTAEDIQAIVSTVDIFGGRGNLTSDRAKGFKKFADHFLYSPRLAISNVQFFKRMAGFAIDPSTSGRAKAMIATEYLRLGATYAIISILARLFSKMLSDDPDEQRFQFDPGHSAFLTLMRGQRRMDISGGAAMWARSVSQILGIGDKLDTETGLVTQTGKKFTKEWPFIDLGDRQNLDYNAVGRLVRSKLDPWTGMMVDLLAGKTYSGQAAGPLAKANFPDYAWRYPNLTSSIAPVPLSIQSLADMLRGDTEQGIAPLHNPLHLLEAFGAQFVGTGASSLPISPELAQEVDEGYTRNAEEMRTLKNRLQGVLSDRKMSPEMKELKAGRIQDKLDRLRGL